MTDFGNMLRDILTPPPRCGSCKGTGEKHGWNATGDLVRVKPLQPCESCSGLGFIPNSVRCPSEGPATAQATGFPATARQSGVVGVRPVVTNREDRAERRPQITMDTLVDAIKPHHDRMMSDLRASNFMELLKLTLPHIEKNPETAVLIQRIRGAIAKAERAMVKEAAQRMRDVAGGR